MRSHELLPKKSGMKILLTCTLCTQVGGLARSWEGFCDLSKGYPESREEEFFLGLQISFSAIDSLSLCMTILKMKVVQSFNLNSKKILNTL